MNVSSTSVYFTKHVNTSTLINLTIAIIGYGNQGRAQALNLRDSGCKVIVGNQDDEYRERLKKSFRMLKSLL